MNGPALLGLFAVAFAVWALTLALIWRAFRSWQYLMDLGALPPSADGASPGGDKTRKKPGSWEDLSRGQLMALRARVVLSGLPPGSSAAMVPFARRFRWSVLGVVVLSCGIGLGVVALEPSLWSGARLFFVGLGLWAAVHLGLLWRWKDVPGAVAA